MLLGAVMKKLAIAIASIALLGTPAFAADMAVKAAPPAPAPVYNWTGWYVGVNAGASFGRAKTDFNVAPIAVTTTGPTIPVAGFAGSDTVSPSGFIGGGQIGYNWQVSPIWVVGLEADFQGSLEKESATLTNSVSNSTFFLTGTVVTQYDAKIDWFGTVRGRIGYVWGNGEVLTYFTGGLAYARVVVDGTSTVSGSVGPPQNAFSIVRAVGHSQFNIGWVVGYGTEGVIDFWGARNWTWKIEGLYMDLGSLNDPDVAGQVTGATGGQISTHTHFTDGILRGGLNYRF
jgi:outer membrane immunogenic protein